MDTEIIQTITRVEQKVQDHDHEIRDLKKRQDALDNIAASVKVLDTKMDSTEGRVERMDTKLDSLLQKPGKWWETAIEKLITALVGGLIAFVLFKLGLGA